MKSLELVASNQNQLNKYLHRQKVALSTTYEMHNIVFNRDRIINIELVANDQTLPLAFERADLEEGGCILIDNKALLHPQQIAEGTDLRMQRINPKRELSILDAMFITNMFAFAIRENFLELRSGDEIRDEVFERTVRILQNFG